MILPTDFDERLADTSARRCPACHRQALLPIEGLNRGKAMASNEALERIFDWLRFECRHEDEHITAAIKSPPQRVISNMTCECLAGR